MTALDQAFIRAYAQQGVATTTVARGTDTPRQDSPTEQAALTPAPEVFGLLDEFRRVDCRTPVEPAAALAEPAVAPAVRSVPTTCEQPFRPMLQVEDFLWPSICRRLDQTADAELDRLADALCTCANEGYKILAMAACGHGDGATTLLLCAGQRLARRGLRVVMVDTRRGHPELTRRLGIEPEHGWNDVSAGRMSLGEVVIESLANGLALLPECENSAPADSQPEISVPPSESLDVLASHYDLVLLDTGLPDNGEPLGDWPGPGIAPRLDAVVLVHNVGTTTRDRLEAIQHRLAAAGIVLAGVIQNYVRS